MPHEPMCDVVGEMARRWPDPDRGPFALRVIVGMVDGALSIIGLELYGDRVRPSGMASLRNSAGTEPAGDFDLRDYDFPNGDELGDEPHAIGSLDLRQLGTDKLLDEFKRGSTATLRAFLEEHPDHGTPEARALAADIERFGGGKRHREGALGPAHYERVARTYKAALLNGLPPTTTVATEFNVHKSTAAKWVARCRNDLGLLPKTSKGKAKGAER